MTNVTSCDSVLLEGRKTMNTKQTKMVNAIELAELLWPGEVNSDNWETKAASARRWARRQKEKHPRFEPATRLEVIFEKDRAVLVWDADMAMDIRNASQGSGNWGKRPREDS